MPKRGPDPDIPDERLLFEIMFARGPAVFTSEVEQELDLSRQRINERLTSLEEEDLLVSKKASGRRLWWITEAGKAQAAEFIRENLS